MKAGNRHARHANLLRKAMMRLEKMILNHAEQARLRRGAKAPYGACSSLGSAGTGRNLRICWVGHCFQGMHSRMGVQTLIELLRTNDLVLISKVEAILGDSGIAVFLADRHMSALEGSLSFLPRRVLVAEDEAARARTALLEAGLGPELRDG
jgi:Putative prokaryotic signal transducing protein